MAPGGTVLERDFALSVDGHGTPFRLLSRQGRTWLVEPGDALIWTRFMLPLREEDSLWLVDRVSDSGLVLMKKKGSGTGQPAACWMGTMPIESERARSSSRDDAERAIGEETESVFVNPMESMSPSEIGSLRCVHLAEWRPEFEDLLARIDTRHCAVSVDEPALRAFRYEMPPLPRDLRYLHLDFFYGTAWGRSQLPSLSRFQDLEVLVMPHGNLLFNLEALRDARKLRVFCAEDARLRGLEHLESWTRLRSLEIARSPAVTDEGVESLAVLSGLRHLDISSCLDLEDLSFVRSLPELESLDIRHDHISSLAPLGEHPSLRRVQAGGSQVSWPPEGPMPQLERIDVVATRLSDDARAAMSAQNEGAQVIEGWLQSLETALFGIDHVRVTERDLPHSPRTLFEVDDPAEIRKLLDLLEFEDSREADWCLCLGDPVLEFSRRGKLAASLTLHHGTSAAWRGWPGHAHFTVPSRQALARWLRARGEHDFTRELLEIVATEDADARLAAETAAILPYSVLEHWRGKEHSDAKSPDPLDADALGPPDENALAVAIVAHAKSQAEMAEIALRLLGCGTISWDCFPTMGLHGIACALLDELPPGSVRDVIVSIEDDWLAWEGAVRWLLRHRGLDALSRDAWPALVIEAAFHRALSHPHEDNRRLGLEILDEEHSPLGEEALEGLLDGRITPSENAGHASESSGVFCSECRGREDRPEGLSERAWAGLILADRGRADLLPTMREALRECRGTSRRALKRAIKELERE